MRAARRAILVVVLLVVFLLVVHGALKSLLEVLCIKLWLYTCIACRCEWCEDATVVVAVGPLHCISARTVAAEWDEETHVAMQERMGV